MTTPLLDTVIVGGGLAGLAAARALHAAGRSFLLLEASDGFGGRVRTDEVDGFLLDRGFQVLLTAYPEASRQLDIAALRLQRFEPGALVWRNGKGSVVSDPFRRPGRLLSTAVAPIGSPLDKARLAWMRHRLRSVDPRALLRGPDTSTGPALRARGFSPEIISRFFTPLVGGIQLDPQLRTSSRMFDVIMRMLYDGDSAVPAAGMGAIPAQLVAHLPPESLRLHAAVAAVAPGTVHLADGSTLSAGAVVVATEGPVASRLLGLPEVGSRSAGCVCFATDRAPIDQRLVVLDGSGKGPVLNVTVMSNIAPTYAPPGQHLVVAALPGVAEGDLESLARAQLRGWWGAQVDDWRHLRTYHIPHGQPDQSPPFRPKQAVSLGDGMYVCGDHRDTGSIQGALYSGRRCGELVAAATAMAPAG